MGNPIKGFPIVLSRAQRETIIQGREVEIFASLPLFFPHAFFIRRDHAAGERVENHKREVRRSPSLKVFSPPAFSLSFPPLMRCPEVFFRSESLDRTQGVSSPAIF